VGLLERNTSRCWLEVVARQNAHTLEQIISNHVLPVTVIVTDGWAGYDNVSFMNNGVYQHEVIIHAEHFMDEINPKLNTQRDCGCSQNARCDIRATQAVHCSQVIWLPFSGAIATRHMFLENFKNRSVSLIASDLTTQRTRGN